MAPKKSNKNAASSSAESDVSTPLRRSTRNQANKSNIAASSSKQVLEKRVTKRKAEAKADSEPDEKKTARTRSSRSKTVASNSESVKKKSSKNNRKKRTPAGVSSDIELDSEDEVCHFDRLPAEVLTEILSYLSFRDRKSSRLVCQRWFEAHNVLQLSNDEKLLCYALYDFDVVMKTLENSTRKIMNLEFYDMDFNPVRSSNFWMKCGSKIESLLFSDCVLPDETMKNIIIHCTKLKCLSLENMSNREEGQRMCSDTCLNALVNLRIRRDSLYFLEMNINDTGWISNNFLRALFTIYPNIKQFSFYCDTVEDDFNNGNLADETLLRSTEKCTFTSILRKLVDSRRELESITLDVGDYQSLDFLPACQICTAISPLYFPELRDIKVDLEIFGDQQHTILDFFSRHKLLQSVECQIFVETSTAEFIGQLMNCLLDSCSNLMSLQILQDVYLNFGFALESSVFDKLRKSKLDSLSFNFGLEIAPSNPEFVNYTLRSLCILAPGVEKDTFLTLCKTFQGLTHLEMVNIDDEGLQCVLQHLHYLTSLKLIDCQNLTDYGFTGCRPDEENNDESEGYSIQVLNKLQYLELKMTGDSVKITDKTFAHLKFPDLLYLHVTIEVPWKFCEAFVKTFANFSKMEGLACYFDEIVNYSVWSTVCKKLKKLRYLHVQFKEFKSFGDKNYKSLFQYCPTLRALQHRSHIGSRSQSYYYDVVKRKVAKKKSEREYRISSEQIDTFSVNWMWF